EPPQAAHRQDPRRAAEPDGRRLGARRQLPRRRGAVAGDGGRRDGICRAV
ncbi:MAG: hypothetical protein AVDCRST_MAG38-2523, partial [uncultured Solirubrobacteraceae bacterium]